MIGSSMLVPANMENELMSWNVRSSRGLACFLIVGGAAGIGSSVVRAATIPVSGTYVSLGAGADFQQNEILGAIPTAGEPQRSAHFDDPGFSGEASLGYGFGNGLRVELEGNYLNDHIRKISFPAGDIRRAGGYQQQYGGFANVLYDIPVALPVTPYVGLGAGGQVLEIDNLNSSTPGFRFPHPGGSSTIDSFAYQAIAGLSIPVPYVRGLALTAEYRFTGLLDPLQAIPFHTFSARTSLPLGEGNERLGNVFHHSILFGLRYAFDTAPPAPPPGPAPVMAPAPAAARTYLVFFDWDSAELTARARQIVADAAQNAMHVRTTRLEVDGYADSSHALPGRSGQDYNLSLSLRRTDAVRAELVRDGVAAAAIQVHGYGDTNLLVPTGPNVREPQNRRVEIIVR